MSSWTLALASVRALRANLTRVKLVVFKQCIKTEENVVLVFKRERVFLDAQT